MIAIIGVLLVGAGWLGVLIAQDGHRLWSRDGGPPALGLIALVPALGLVAWLMVMRDGVWLAVLVLTAAAEGGAATLRMFRQ